jgi:NAD(P)-dependent dehydrogenase (short-subunit alcohol dehydrogenase family)
MAGLLADPMGGSMADRVVLVAGVGTGLGSALVSLLASEGATVVAVARTTAAVDPLAAHARRRGWTVHARTANIADAAATEKLVRDAIAEFGRIDALSVNVGHWFGGETPLHRLTPEEWSAGLRDNLDPTYLLGRVVIPHMLERHRGSVVLVSAALPVRWAGSAAYCAAKAGVADLVPKLARDYRESGIRFNGVLPGSMTRGLPSLDPPAPDAPLPLTDETATSSWEVARAVCYLLSDASRWVTGSLLTVDGGASTGAPEPGRRA